MLSSHSVINRRTVILAWHFPVVGLLMRSNTHKFTRNVVHVASALGCLLNCKTTSSCCLCVCTPIRMVLVKIPVEITREIFYIIYIYIYINSGTELWNYCACSSSLSVAKF
jgi:hypothetical protein